MSSPSNVIASASTPPRSLWASCLRRAEACRSGAATSRRSSTALCSMILTSTSFGSAHFRKRTQSKKAYRLAMLSGVRCASSSLRVSGAQQASWQPPKPANGPCLASAAATMRTRSRVERGELQQRREMVRQKFGGVNEPQPSPFA